MSTADKRIGGPTTVLGTELGTELEVILSSRQRLANILSDYSRECVGPMRRRLVQLSHWFGDPQLTATDLLSHPETLAICVPLVKQLHRSAVDPNSGPASTASTTEQKLDHDQLVAAVRGGVERIAGTVRRKPQVLVLIAYPLVIWIVSLAMFIFFCFSVVPHFERMFWEFGLDVPPMTYALIEVSRAIRHWAWLGGAVAVAGLVVGLLYVVFASVRARSGHRSSFYRSSFYRSRRLSKRAAVAQWAWHVSMLMDVDVSQADAIAIAGESSGAAWLARHSRRWSEQLSQGGRPFETLRKLRGMSIQTLTYVLRLPATANQADALYDVSVNYYDRVQLTAYWWLSWARAMTVIVIGIGVGEVVCALFGPLVQLIGGLT